MTAAAFVRHVFILITAAGFGFVPTLLGAFDQAHDCPMPERFYESEPPLPKTAKALVTGREVVIAVLGGSSTLGLAAGATALAWPARLGSVLTDKFPSARIKIVNRAVARQTAKQVLERLDRDILPLKPNLVIWETGTMEAVRGSDVDAFRETVRTAIDELRAAGVEVVLMNMQFSRETDAMIHFEPYLIAMRQVADATETPLFRRRGIMRYWAESGLIDLRVKDDKKRRQLAVKLYDCIGRAMAGFVTRGTPDN
ncbi:MAG TPA: SGNH/GDSL hydrolase family protein [Candidatus Binatia bacterium]|nr:SGNH/GDSL hydrolase family protein [Candidatus Binatia bacterium]